MIFRLPDPEGGIAPWHPKQPHPVPQQQGPPPTCTSMGMMPGDDQPASLSYNKRNIQKWEKDEPLGEKATITPVLYCNLKHPQLKIDYPGLLPNF